MSARDPLAPCRTCFWSAELTRREASIWCSHAVHHGWLTTGPSCGGATYRVDDRPPSAATP